MAKQYLVTGRDDLRLETVLLGSAWKVKGEVPPGAKVLTPELVEQELWACLNAGSPGETVWLIMANLFGQDVADASQGRKTDAKVLTREQVLKSAGDSIIKARDAGLYPGPEESMLLLIEELFGEEGE